MSVPLRALIVEDSEDDALLIVRELRRSGYDLTFEQLDTAEAMQEALTREVWDIIIADYSMPRFSGMEALGLLQMSGMDLPFIIVSGTIGEDIAVAAMRAGAHDYVLKDSLTRLGPAVQRELQEAEERHARRRAEQLQRESEARFRRMAENIQDGLTIIEHDQVVYANRRACEIFGYPEHEYMQMTMSDFAAPEEGARLQEIKDAGQGIGGGPREVEFWIVRKDGAHRYIQNRYSPSLEGDQVVGAYVVTTDITDRKLAERELMERRRYLERVLAAAPDAIVTLDANYAVVEWNAGAARLFGYSREEVIGQNLDRLITNYDTLQEAADFTRVIVYGQDLAPVEIVRYRKDGSPVNVIAAGSPIVVDDRFAGLVVVYTDITELKRAEKALRENEEKYGNLFRHSSDGIFLHDLQGNILDVNQRALEQFGYSRSEVLALKMPDLHPPEALDASKQGLKRVVQDRFVNLELDFRKKNGQVFPAEVSASLFELGGQVVVQSVIRDITERKRAERLLKALNEVALAMERVLTQQEILTTVGEGFKKLGFSSTIFLADEQQSRLFPKYCSYEPRAVKAAEKLLGIKAEEFSINVESVDVFRKVLWEGQTVLVAGDEGLRQVLPGSWKRFASQIVKILNIRQSVSAPLIVEDKVIGLLSVQSDDLTEDDLPAITAFAHQLSAAWRKAKLVEDLEMSLRELKRTQVQFLQAQKMEAVGRLAGGVAHDFNNTLTIIHLSTQLLKRQLHSEDPLREYVQQIEEAGQRAANLTKQLLSFSRREIIQPRVVDLGKVVGDLSRMLQRIIGEDIELATILADDLWPVYLDPTQIDQAIVNLVVNARDAMPEGGCLTIETANVVLDEVSAAQHVDLAPGEYVRLIVSDTGIGMDEETLEHIFEPFFTTKEREHGTGLGLSTVFGIVKQNRGHITVYSQVGGGTTFKIYLPRTIKPEAQRSSCTAAVSPVRGSETILVVEDDSVVRDLAVQILKAHGYEVLAAEGGPQAVELCQEYGRGIDLLLSDMVMPQMYGRELAEQLRAQRPQMRVLYMSGHSDDVIAYHGVLDEADVFLAKPFTLETLTQKVRHALDVPP